MAAVRFSQAFSVDAGFAQGWASLKLAPIPLLLGGLIMGCTDGGSSGGIRSEVGGGHGYGGHDLDHLGLWVLLTLVGLFFGLVVFLIRSWIHPGYIRLQRSLIEEREGDFTELFSGADLLAPIAVFKLMRGVILIGVGAIASIPGGLLLALGGVADSEALMVLGCFVMAVLALPVVLFVGLGLMLGELTITIDGTGPTDALARSWRLTQGNRLHLLLFWIVFAVVRVFAAVVGVLACCFGLLVTVPAAHSVYHTALTRGYLLYTRGDATPADDVVVPA